MKFQYSSNFSPSQEVSVYSFSYPTLGCYSWVPFWSPYANSACTSAMFSKYYTVGIKCCNCCTLGSHSSEFTIFSRILPKSQPQKENTARCGLRLTFWCFWKRVEPQAPVMSQAQCRVQSVDSTKQQQKFCDKWNANKEAAGTRYGTKSRGRHKSVLPLNATDVDVQQAAVQGAIIPCIRCCCNKARQSPCWIERRNKAYLSQKRCARWEGLLCVTMRNCGRALWKKKKKKKASVAVGNCQQLPHLGSDHCIVRT